MKTTGIVFSYSEIESLNENGFLTDIQLLDDNGGDPYGNCIIVHEDQFTKEEIESLDLVDRIIDIYYTQDFDDQFSELDFEGEWYAKGCTYEANFVEECDYYLLIDALES